MTSTRKTIKLGTHLTLFTKINSKWIIDLIARCKATKILDDNTGKDLDELGFGDDIFSYNTKT